MPEHYFFFFKGASPVLALLWQRLLQFTVGKTPLCNALQQGIVPTTEQICCTVGGTPSWRLLWGGWAPTVNCRKGNG